jgi:colanic acid/amylovoran biosynthesis glycosyltransferase
MGRNTKVIWVDNSFPHQSPFLKNKYEGLSKVLHGILIHSGKAKPKESKIETIRIASSKIGLILRFILKLLLKPIKVINFIKTGKKYIGNDIYIKAIVDNAFIGIEADIIHFEFGTLAIGKTYLKHILDCKLIVSFRGYDINYFALDNKTVFSEIWEEADLVHFLGNDLRNRAIARGCPENINYFLISPALDLTLFTPRLIDEYNMSQNTIKIISTGRLTWKKGYEYGLKAIQLLLSKGLDIEYTIIGEGNYREAILFCINELKLTKNVKLVGHISQSEIANYLKQADIFLHSAVSEGFCNAVVEAQAIGLPIVCTNADGLIENIEEGVTGFSVPTYDSLALASKLELLINSPEKRRKMGQDAVIRANSLYSIEKQISSFSIEYDKLIRSTI